MKGQEVLFSHQSDERETPQKLFEQLNMEFGFTLDAAASDSNAKLPKYYTEKDDGLTKSWNNEIVFVNPPYSKADEFVKKAYEESQNGVTVVMLLPVRTSNKWFHEYIYNKEGVEIRFLKGRLVFEMDGKPILGKKGNKQVAPFPSMVVIFKGKVKNES